MARPPLGPAANGFDIDRSTREIIGHDGHRVRLAEKPWLVLEALAAAEGAVVTREALRSLLWSGDTFVDFDNNLNSAVTTLRQALGDRARSPVFIETIPKVGYRLLTTGRTARSGSAPASGPTPSGTVAAWTFPGLASVLALVAIAGALTVETSRSTLQRATGTPGAGMRPAARAAYERGLYLRAQFLIGRRDVSQLAAARDAFARARVLDPATSSAAAEEADTLVEMSFAGATGFRDGMSRARDVAQQALRGEPRSAVALRTMGLSALFLDWNPGAARLWLDRAVASGPRDSRTALARATLFAAMGQADKAVDAAELAVALDPAAQYVRADLAMFYLTAGRLEAAADSSERVLMVDPGFEPALMAAVTANQRLGRWPEAARFARALMQTAGAPEADLARAGLAESVEAVAILRDWDLARITSMSAGREDDFALDLALRHAARGDRRRALDYLERSLARRQSFLVFLRSFPELSELHGDPRFERIALSVLRRETAPAS